MYKFNYSHLTFRKLCPTLAEDLQFLSIILLLSPAISLFAQEGILKEKVEESTIYEADSHMPDPPKERLFDSEINNFGASNPALKSGPISVEYSFIGTSGPLSSIGDISISPSPVYYYKGVGSFAAGQGKSTFTLSQPATVVSVESYSSGPGGITYGTRIYAYDEADQLIDQAVDDGAGWVIFTFNAPVGRKISKFELENEFDGLRSYPWIGQYYIKNIWVTYVSNEPPVVITQNVNLDSDDNCQANADVANFNNGSYDPDGDALTFSLSPAGPYPVGTTSVTLTASDGELTGSATASITVVDNTAPIPDIANLPDVVGECSVSVDVPTAFDNCVGSLSATTSDPLEYNTQGTFTISWSYTDDNGNESNQTQTVIVADITPPELFLSNPTITIWPPNHKYKQFNLDDFGPSVSDNCGVDLSSVYIKSISSDEPEDAKGGGDGNTTNDIYIYPGCQSVDLRAERQGKGNGRVYTLHLSVMDFAGNEAETVCYVHVPHNNKGFAVDDGENSGYTIFSDCNGGQLKSGQMNNIRSISPEYDFDLKSYPNPFKYSTNLEFELPEQTHVVLNIYSMTGRLVRTLIDKEMPVGYARIQWDGNDNQGNALSSGMYFGILRTKDSAAKTNMILTR